jgi:hypothetical protein
MRYSLNSPFASKPKNISFPNPRRLVRKRLAFNIAGLEFRRGFPNPGLARRNQCGAPIDEPIQGMKVVVGC